MTQLTPVEVYEFLRGAGFPQKQAIALTAVARRESNLCPGVVNDTPATGDRSYGLLQINMANSGIREDLAAHGLLDDGHSLLDPAMNARAAYLLWNRSDRNLDILWYINRPGIYQDRYNLHLPEAMAAALASPV